MILINGVMEYPFLLMPKRMCKSYTKRELRRQSPILESLLSDD